MADDHRHGDIIIIKKKGGGVHGHHGGAWKIAFADFMTAMMAFFLVLWIINATDKDTKTVIARYFNPVRLENPSRATKGVHGQSSAPTEGKDEKSAQAAGVASKEKGAKGSPPSQVKAEKKEKTKEAPEPPPPSPEAKLQAAEARLFAQPYEALDRIAAAAGESAPGASPEKGDADPQRQAGALSIDAFRDPFKPIGPGSPDDLAAFDADARPQARQDLERAKTGPQETPGPKPAPSANPAPSASPASSPKPAASLAPSPIATPKQGENRATGEAPQPAPSPEAGPPEAGKTAEGVKGASASAKLEKEIKAGVEAALGPGAGPQIEARQTKEGLLVSLTDKLDFSMFSVGSATPRPEIVRAMAAIAKVVKARPGHIVVRGYTDARPYRNGAYDNWRLSSDRAQMAYYMLTRGGVPAARFVRVEGYADRALKDPAHPLAAVNRRLEILIAEPKP
jgi:chemotaxis protein MotB